MPVNFITCKNDKSAHRPFVSRNHVAQLKANQTKVLAKSRVDTSPPLPVHIQCHLLVHFEHSLCCFEPVQKSHCCSALVSQKREARVLAEMTWVQVLAARLIFDARNLFYCKMFPWLNSMHYCVNNSGLVSLSSVEGRGPFLTAML